MSAPMRPVKYGFEQGVRLAPPYLDTDGTLRC